MAPSSRPPARRPSVWRRTVVTLTALGLGAGFALVGADAASAKPKHEHGGHSSSGIALPDGFQPEGIAIQGKRVYAGSRVTGDIYVADLKTGKGRVLSQGPGTPSLGLEADGRLLWVAGGAGGDARLVDTRSGRVRASIDFADAPAGATFVNDEVRAGRYVWFTDSYQPQLYRVDRKHPMRAATTVRLTGAWNQTPGPVVNANGITRTPDGEALLLVKSDTGQLFRVDTTGVATLVDLGGATLANGDGMLLRGRTLYVVQNRLNQVAVVTLDEAGTAGQVVRTITSPAFDVPTTVARAGKDLYLPNARFGAADAGSIAYSITKVRS